MSSPGSEIEKYVPLEEEQQAGGVRDFLTILFKHKTKDRG